MFVPIMISLIGTAAIVVGIVLAKDRAESKKSAPAKDGASRPAADVAPEVTFEEFQKLVSSPDKPVVVMFYATWCPSCTRQGPFFREAAQNMANDAVFVRMDTDKCKPFARQLALKKIPTTFVFKGSESPRGNLVGVHPPGALKAFIEDALSDE